MSSYNYKGCACLRAAHPRRFSKGRCTVEVVLNHYTGWCFMCMDDCAGWLRRLWWRITRRG